MRASDHVPIWAEVAVSAPAQGAMGTAPAAYHPTF